MERAITAPMITIKIPPVPDCVNADMMTRQEIRNKIMLGYEDAMAGRMEDAETIFAEFMRTHN